MLITIAARAVPVRPHKSVMWLVIFPKATGQGEYYIAPFWYKSLFLKNDIKLYVLLEIACDNRIYIMLQKEALQRALLL